ncbi:hypothetical protein F4553_004059 [Allocatelliglobosispora scoriae]|uniref:PknH-like extracellular domain-containing protein n=1 Tax=Allocatelliglobosispora scoriae TaxID=643052 RepID=A0A841BV89_9ACTN|nr:hypothetical protein [Allocatelliglobosispora scoriae]MBB5870680.1 hypothetical protein [Allocatelliglobosispora scoriae]
MTPVRRLAGAHLILLVAIACTAACDGGTPIALPPTPSASAATPAASPGPSNPGASNPVASNPVTPPPDAPPTAPVVPACAADDARLIPESVLVRDAFVAGTFGEEQCLVRVPAEPFHEFLPNPCNDRGALPTAGILARRAIEVYFDDDPDNGNPETSRYRQVVTLYDSAAAAKAYVDDVLADVARCARRKVGKGHVFAYSVKAPGELGVQRFYSASAESMPNGAIFQIFFVREGAKVSVVTDVGWEGYPSRPESLAQVGKRAAEVLRAWR